MGEKRIAFSVDFFRDEVRHGFYIPTAIKQAWAACLTVLSEIDRICEKYGITYYADWGTILGAVRHGGFVPWDDDLDICMRREDYVRFRQVADRELPEEFVIHDYERKENHWLFLSRVVNNSHICFEEQHLDRYHNFPYLSAVDIFVQDYLYDDEERERERCNEVKRLIAVADGIVNGTLSDIAIEKELSEFQKKYNTVIDMESDTRQIGIELYRLAEAQMARVDEKDASRLGQIFPFVLKGRGGLPKEYYNKIIRLPYENTTIPVPACYDAVLRSRYGNYLQIHKVWGGHQYPYFEKQKEQLQKLSADSILEFEFSGDMLKRAKLPNEESYKNTVIECVSQLCDMTEQLVKFTADQEWDHVISLLPECQQLSVDMGSYIEEIKGEHMESTKHTVSAIQSYCDALYENYQAIAEGNADGCLEKLAQIQSSFEQMKNVIKDYIIDRQEVLFLPIGPGEWKGFERIYRECIAAGDKDIYVLPLPLLFKDSLGRVKADSEEIVAAAKMGEYPESVELTSWVGYDVKIHHPETIYIQNPYDGTNPCLTVPGNYYAEIIRQYTDELVFVPGFKVDEFGENDYTDIYNMKHYVTAPGIIYADKVLVQSENMRKQYIRKLTDFAGEDTKYIWEERICLNPYIDKEYGNDSSEENIDKNILKSERKKSIFYCIGLNEMSEHRDGIIECIRDRFLIFKNNSDAIDVVVSLFPSDYDEWRRIDSELTDKLLELIDKYAENEWCKVHRGGRLEYDSIVKACDAYYGSASFLVPMFMHDKKPVMISCYDF